MSDLSGYTVRLFKVPLFGVWSWRVTAPGDREIAPFGLGFASKQAAERDALRRIEIDLAAETLSGQQLRDRLSSSGAGEAGPSPNA